MPTAAPSAHVYISRSKNDEKLAEQLRRRVRPFATIVREMSEADVILLLISQAYVYSESSVTEADLALMRTVDDDVLVVPIVIEKVKEPLPALGLPTLPRDGVPLSNLKDQKRALAEIASDLERMIGEWPAKRTLTRTAPPARPTQPSPSPRSSPQPSLSALNLSPSVRRATADFGDRPIGTASIVQQIFEVHGEYGDGLAKLVTVDEPTTDEKLRIEQWLARVRELFREDVVPTLHGRTLVRGLALLDAGLTKQLLAHGFLSELEGELDPPLLDILTSKGYRLWEPGDVPTLGDRPARVDRLHRRQFAKELAGMIDDERKRSNAKSGRPESFLVHLHGPWGSGKTSLLGFVGDELADQETRWVVVPFNAWQQERLEAPWWSLMTAVHRAGKRMAFPEAGPRERGWDRQRRRDLRRSAKLLWLDLVWRIRLGWMAYLLLPLVVALLYLGWTNGFFDTAASSDGWLTQAGDIAKPVAAVVGLAAALFGAVRGLGRSLSVGSARGAETFMKSSQDPMRTLRKRFERVVVTIGRPIAVFVDDLDRCQASYVVEVLQGIQTLLIEAPVTYIVAADRRWLYDSYAKFYADFESVAREPGRPLGHLFLEKTFQLSAALPQLDPATRSSFWRGLIVPNGEEGLGDEERLRREASERVQDVGLSEALREADAGRERLPGEQRAVREAVASRLSDSEVEEEIKYRLMPFAQLLEPNPRAMKRLVNAYRIELRRMLAEGRQVGSAAVTPEQLALWTILTMRWPLLADRLALHPGAVSGEQADAMGDLHGLWQSDAVQAVISGDGVPAQLTESAVRAVVGLDQRRRSEVAPRTPVGGNGQGVVA
jgi:hypothetical protein